MKTIYLDNAAATRTSKEVLREMNKYFTEFYGNPSSFHSLGLSAKNAVESARNKVAKILNSKSNEIYFTGSGTESINLALQGVARANKNKGKHIITTAVEHHAVLETCKFLEAEGFSITYLKTDRHGMVTPNDVRKAIRNDTILVSIIFANNEIGTINPITEIGKVCREKGIYFHTDACQAAGYIRIDVEKLNTDLLTLNGSKIYGPKGVGMLYARQGINIKPIIFGGGQESDLRPGTENVPGIAGFAKALELCDKNREKENMRVTQLRNRLTAGLLKIPKTFLNGHPEKRLPNNVNISFLDVEGESVLLYLDKHGICASTGSACSSKSLEASHVLLGIGLKPEEAHGAIRFSLGKETTEQDVNYVLKIMLNVIKKLRDFSPVRIGDAN